jgi:DNA-binding FrmR family transcriptional regulator
MVPTLTACASWGASWLAAKGQVERRLTTIETHLNSIETVQKNQEDVVERLARIEGILEELRRPR